MIGTVIAGFPNLDIHTLAEDWCMAESGDATWQVLALSLGLKPSHWRDAGGQRMYAGVLAAQTSFDLENPVLEDDAVEIRCVLNAIRKPHAISTTSFSVAGQIRASVRLLISFVRRDMAGSNKKFSKVNGVWGAPDVEPQMVDDLLNLHHQAKSRQLHGTVTMTHQANRIQDFNAADLFYFKNFVRLAKAAEWHENRGRPVRLNAGRKVWYFGNVDDGEAITVRVKRAGDAARTEFCDPSDRLIFVSDIVALPVTLQTR